MGQILAFVSVEVHEIGIKKKERVKVDYYILLKIKKEVRLKGIGEELRFI